MNVHAETGREDGSAPPAEISSVSMLRDSTARLTVIDVSQPAFDQQFRPVRSAEALGFTDDAIWLRFSDANLTRNGSWLLELTPSYIDDAQLYSPRDSGGYSVEQQGNLIHLSPEGLPHASLVFHLNTASVNSHTYYLRLRTQSSMLFRLKAWQAADLIPASARNGLAFGAYFGMVFLISCFNLVFWLWTREPLHLAYLIYVLINCASFSLTMGQLGPFFQHATGLLGHLQKGFVVLQVCAIGYFFAWLYRLPRHMPKLERANRLIAFAVLVYALMVGLGWLPFAGRFTFLIALYFIAFTETGAFVAVARGDKDVRFYLTAFTPFLISASMLIFRALGWIANWHVIDYIPIFSACLHMILINVGLAEKARRAELDRRTQDQVTLSLAMQNERELELRVIQRTRALERANSALQREVSERAELQGQLRSALQKEREAMATQRQFVAMVSHEFRTPLAIIDTTAQRILLQFATEHATLSAPMNKIRRGVQRLNDLIDNFLGEERLPTHASALSNVRLDLRELALRCIAQHSPLSSGLIDCISPPYPVMVVGDPSLLALVLSNLVDNAIKYSPPGNPVSLKVASDETRGWIDVVDYGSGIAASDRERIFEKHVRLGVVTGVGGTGLGLHIARNAARRMNGDIELESEVGRGSCFRLWLPQADRSQEPANAASVT